MSKAIFLPDSLYERLQVQAQAQGLSIEEYLERLQKQVEKGRESRFQDDLIEKGILVTWPKPAPLIANFEPIEVKGSPLSETIIEDRR